jgi:hypothetical protein
MLCVPFPPEIIPYEVQETIVALLANPATEPVREITRRLSALNAHNGKVMPTLIEYAFGALQRVYEMNEWEGAGEVGSDAGEMLYVSLMLAALVDGELLLQVTLNPGKMLPDHLWSHFRYEALQILARVGPESLSARRALANAVEACDYGVRLDVIRALEAKKRDGADVSWAVSILRRALFSNADEAVRETAAALLGKIGTGPAVETLLSLLANQKDARDRARTCRALGEAGAVLKTRLDSVIRALSGIAKRDPCDATQNAALLALAVTRTRPSELGRPRINGEELAKGGNHRQDRKRKREPAEVERSLLALIDTCLEWPHEVVSERKLHESELLRRKRREFGLAEAVSLATVHNHLRTLARLCRLEDLLAPHAKRQFSLFHEAARERLRLRRRDIEAEVDEQWRRWQEEES